MKCEVTVHSNPLLATQKVLLQTAFHYSQWEIITGLTLMHSAIISACSVSTTPLRSKEGFTQCSLGNYLPKRKGVSAYISDVYAYISDFANRPKNECFIRYGALRIGILICYLGKINIAI